MYIHVTYMQLTGPQGESSAAACQTQTPLIYLCRLAAALCQHTPRPTSFGNGSPDPLKREPASKLADPVAAAHTSSPALQYSVGSMVRRRMRINPDAGRSREDRWCPRSAVKLLDRDLCLVGAVRLQGYHQHTFPVPITVSLPRTRNLFGTSSNLDQQRHDQFCQGTHLPLQSLVLG